MTGERAERAEYVPKAWEEPGCPFCGRREHALHERFGYRLRFTWVRCLGCGLIYQCPRPRYDADFIEAAYGNYFTYSADFEPGDRAGPSSYQEWVEELEEIVGLDESREAILDVGCNMGNFLLAARAHYRTVMGTEVSAKQAAFVEQRLGVPVFLGQLDELGTPERFSCIHMSHVLEHVPDPGAWLRKAHELLRPRGLLVVNVPNALSLDRRFKVFLKDAGLRRGAWRQPWRTPDHLFEPTAASMLRFLAAHGFAVVEHYSYSRRDPTARSLWSRLYQRRLRQGSNLKFYARKLPRLRS